MSNHLLQFFISNQEKFLKLIKLILHNLTYISFLHSFLFSSTFSIFLQSVFFLHSAVSHVFQGPDSSGFTFFRFQFFQVSGFSGSRFFRVRVKGPGPSFRSSKMQELE